MSVHQILEGTTAVHAPRPLADEHWLTRVLVVDDHPAVRLGLGALIEDDPALDQVASVASARDALAKARNLQPDVVVLDYSLPDQDGLSLTYHLRAVPDPPAVLLYSAYADEAMAVVATIAGADGIASKGVDGDELRYAIRWIANGGRWMPETTPTTLSRMAARLEPQDTPIFAMLLHGTRPAEIAEVLGITDSWLEARRWAIVQQLRRQL